MKFIIATNNLKKLAELERILNPLGIEAVSAKEAGVVLTGAGATFPYGKDPKDSNIRIAPSYPTPDELSKAAKLFTLCVKIISIEKLLSE